MFFSPLILTVFTDAATGLLSLATRVNIENVDISSRFEH